MMDPRDRHRLDAYLTREPEEPPEPVERRCRRCATVLADDPERAEDWEDAIACTGQVSVATATYTEDDAAILNVIGWDHLGESYGLPIPAACGDEKAHAPHKVVLWGGVREYRTCPSCGEVDVFVLA